MQHADATWPAIALILAAMALGTAVRLLALRGAGPELARQRRASLGTWWLLATMLCLALLLGRAGACALLAVASGLGLREYVRLLGLARDDRVAVALAFALVPVEYVVAWLQPGAAFLALPSVALMLLTGARLTSGQAAGHVRAAAGLSWGFLVLVHGLAHAALLPALPGAERSLVGEAGPFVLVVVLTQWNDIAQALVGRRLGRRPITPLSPKKTLEGLVGGLVATVGLALALGPALLPVAGLLDAGPGARLGWSALTGLLVGVAGTFGDVAMSAVKREAGVKDGSALLPGMGGVVDRIDSLTFTAPACWILLSLLALAGAP
jgi:phosphatidate cytidylyltransferase